LHKELNALKQRDLPWMYECSKCAPQEALRDLDKADRNFFRRLELKKQGKWKGKPGFPVFKKKSKALSGTAEVAPQERRQKPQEKRRQTCQTACPYRHYPAGCHAQADELLMQTPRFGSHRRLEYGGNAQEPLFSWRDLG
jgi:transposase